MSDCGMVVGGDVPIGPITQVAAGMRAFTALGAVVTVGTAAYEGMSIVNDAFGISDAIADAAASVMLESQAETQDADGEEQ
jgi:hypothetical protein